MELPPTHQFNFEVNADADYPVPEFLRAIDEVYTFFEMHITPDMDNALVDALIMYAKHRGGGSFDK